MRKSCGNMTGRKRAYVRFALRSGRKADLRMWANNRHGGRGYPPKSSDRQCAMKTGNVALARMWLVAPPKINCLRRLCV